MRFKINKVYLIATVIVSFTMSCSDLDDLNKNIKDPTEVSPQSLINSAAKELSDAVVSTNVNDNVFRLYAQYIQQTSYVDESRYNVVTRRIPSRIWANIYRHSLVDFNQARLIMEKKVKENPKVNNFDGELAITNVLESYGWYTLVAVFGDVPYAEALDPSNLTPKYDDGLAIIKAEIGQLEKAVESLGKTTTKVDAKADPIFNGNREQWFKFGNSMLLKLAMLISDADKAFAQQILSKVEVANLITSNENNASFKYLGAAPNTNPQYSDYVLSSRQDFVANTTLLNQLVKDNDPRLEKYYEKNADKKYSGLDPGQIGPFTAHSKITTRISGKEGATEPGVFVEASEIHFLISEALSSGMTLKAGAETSEAHYNKGVTLSMEFWKVPNEIKDNSGKVTSEPVKDYLSKVGKYNSGTWKQSLGMETWKAYFNRPVEAWATLRKLDYPQLKAPKENIPEISGIPSRYSYPQDEVSLNGSNYKAAEAKGLKLNPGKKENALDVKLFWDKN